MIDLGLLDPNWTWSVATSIADGQVVGYGSVSPAGIDSLPFLWDGAMHPVLPIGLSLGPDGGQAMGVNGKGEVVGTYFSPPNNSFGIHAFATLGGTFTIIGSASQQSAVATAINASGLVVGSTWTSLFGDNPHAFAWQAGTGMRDLGTLGSCPDSRAAGVNAVGQAVGDACSCTVCGFRKGRAVLFEGGQVTDLGTLGGPSALASAVNDAGQVVGAADTAELAEHGFVWERGRMTDVGVLPGGSWSLLSAINAAGVAVGIADDASGEGRAVVYRDGVLTDLNTLLDNGDWKLRDAVGVDECGRIAANSRTQNGSVRAVLLVPQPSSP